MSIDDFSWTADKVAELTRLWQAGVVTAEMGRLLGTTKNAVISKVHRIGLEPRVEGVKPQPARYHMMDLRPNTCRYPMWGDGPITFEFCGKPAKPESPYCAAHHATCHVDTEKFERLAKSWTPERRAQARERMLQRIADKEPNATLRRG